MGEAYVLVLKVCLEHFLHSYIVSTNCVLLTSVQSCLDLSFQRLGPCAKILKFNQKLTRLRLYWRYCPRSRAEIIRHWDWLMAFQRHGRIWTSSLLSSLAKLIPYVASLDNISLLSLEGFSRKRSSERDSLEGSENLANIFRKGWNESRFKCHVFSEPRVCKVRKEKTPEGQSFGPSIGGVWITYSLGVLPWGNTAFLRFNF